MLRVASIALAMALALMPPTVLARGGGLVRRWRSLRRLTTLPVELATDQFRRLLTAAHVSRRTACRLGATMRSKGPSILAAVCASMICAACTTVPAPRPVMASDPKIEIPIKSSQSVVLMILDEGPGLEVDRDPDARRAASLDDSVKVKRAFADGLHKARPDLDLVAADAELKSMCANMALEAADPARGANNGHCAAILSRMNAGVVVVLTGSAYATSGGSGNAKFGAGPGPVGGISFDRYAQYRAKIVARVLSAPAWRQIAQLEASGQAGTKEEWVLLYFVVPVPIGGTRVALDEWWEPLSSALGERVAESIVVQP